MNKQYFLDRLIRIRPDNFKVYNYGLLPETFTAHDKIQIECYKHGIFNQKAYSHLSGKNCPECSIVRVAEANLIGIEAFIKRSISRFGDKFKYHKTLYTGQDNDLIITCPVHGDITISSRMHLKSKHGCNKCDYEIPRLISQQKYIEKAKKVHGNIYDYSKVNFLNTTKKVEIICSTHGSFWQGLYDHTAKNTKCPKCSHDNTRLSQADFINKSRLLYGDKYDYNKVKYITNISMVTITCKKHGDFIQRAGSHLAGSECKICKRLEQRRTTEEFIKNAKLIHGDKYNYSKVNYQGNKKHVEIICIKHGSFWQKPNAHLSSSSGCIFCSESKGELLIENILKKYSINHIREYRVLPYKYRYDFYLPELNIFIEFNGYQHYSPIDFFGGKEALQKTKDNDFIKKQIVRNSNGYLITITYLHLNENIVEKELIRGLKRYYKYWFIIDDALRVFKGPVEVIKEFNISMNVLIRDIEKEVKKAVKNIKILF